jgi:hypothetical protein
MSDWAALTAAGIISDTLWIQEFGRALRERRDFQELAIDNALVWREAAEVVAHYNKLVADFNDLQHRAIEAAQEADRRGSAIAELPWAATGLEPRRHHRETRGTLLPRRSPPVRVHPLGHRSRRRQQIRAAGHLLIAKRRLARPYRRKGDTKQQASGRPITITCSSPTA